MNKLRKQNLEGGALISLGEEYRLCVTFIMTGVALLCIAAFAGWERQRNVERQYNAHETFLEAKAQITESFIESSYSENNTSYSPYIRYTYEINNVRYQNHRYAYFGTTPGGTSKEDRADIEVFLRKYPVGATVLVYYDPEAPKESVLNKTKPDIKESSETALMFFWSTGIVFFLSGLVELCYVRLQKKALPSRV